MEEQKPRIQSPSLFHPPLVRPLYSENGHDPTPSSDGNLVPMPIQNPITEDERRSSRAAKRKQHDGIEGKMRATGSKNILKTVRHNQSMQHRYADELKRLEAHAQRIHQILADRSREDARHETVPMGAADVSPPHLADSQAAISSPKEQPVQRSRSTQPPKNQWQSPTPIEEQPIGSLKSQPSSIHQRLLELGLYLNEAGSLSPFSEPSHHSEKGKGDLGQSLTPPAASPLPPSQSFTQVRENLSSETWDQKPAPSAKIENFLDRGRESPANRHPHPPRSRSRSSSLLTLLHRSLRKWGGGLRDGRSLELPRRPIDRISDAALWIATAAIVRVGSRYVLSAFPVLSPVFLILMLAPAIAALSLIVCLPKVGWLPYYRLFLIMVGLVVGGKL